MKLKRAKKGSPNCKCQGELYAKLPEPSIPELPKVINANHRHLAVIDVGEVEVDGAYCLCFDVHPNLAKRGMIITNAPGRITEGKIEVYLLNVGKEIVAIKDNDPVAIFWLEATVGFEEVE